MIKIKQTSFYVIGVSSVFIVVVVNGGNNGTCVEYQAHIDVQSILNTIMSYLKETIPCLHLILTTVL